MTLKNSKHLELLIWQGKAYKRFLDQVNDGGRYEKRIRQIQNKICQAQKQLQCEKRNR